MKKIIIITTLLLFAASTSFAGVSITIDATMSKANTGKTVYGAATAGTVTNASPLIGKTSTGVGIGLLCVTTGLGYSMVTQHTSGTKAYGTTYDGTSIYAKDVTTVGKPLLNVPSEITTAAFTGYTAL